MLGITSLRLYMTALWCEEGHEARGGGRAPRTRARRGPARWRERETGRGAAGRGGGAARRRETGVAVRRVSPRAPGGTGRD